jgi:hypothetical protein
MLSQRNYAAANGHYGTSRAFEFCQIEVAPLRYNASQTPRNRFWLLSFKSLQRSPSMVRAPSSLRTMMSVRSSGVKKPSGLRSSNRAAAMC